MMTLSRTPANEQKIAHLKAAISEVLGQVLQRGFYGSASVEVVISDGTIQSVRRTIEQVER